MQNKQIYVSDTNHNTILLSVFEKEVISTKLFNRLHHISQNSTAYLTFPSNRTKRFEHSLGTMKLCGDLFYYAICNSSKEVIKSLFEQLKNTINESIIKTLILKNPDKYRAILEDKNLNETYLGKFEKLRVSNIFYNSCIPHNISSNDEFIYLVVFQSIRLCGLLHDVGHPPFSHITEYSMMKIYEKIIQKQKNNIALTQREDVYLQILCQYYKDDSSMQLHEQMGNKMTEQLISDILFSSSNWYRDIKFDEKYFKVLTFELVKLIFAESSEILSSIHRIIDGSIDGDRLDYVNRDILNSGINNGIIEYDRLIASAKFSLIDNKYVVTYDLKTINTIEDFFFKRWYLYKNIIYHHRVIKTDTLLQLCLEGIIEDYLLENVEENSEDVKLLPYDISGLWKAIKIAYSNTQYFDALIQWDDSWLLTILKKHYFSEYYSKESSMRFKLEEFLSNRKNYYSIIKTSYDFHFFSNAFECSIENTNIRNQQEYCTIAERYPYNYKNRDMHIIFAYLESYFDFSKNKITEYISQFIDEKYKEKIMDHIVVFKKVKTGLETEPIVHNFSETFEISKLSNIKSILETEKSSNPYFYIYLNLSKDFIMPQEFKKSFLENLGRYVAEQVNKIIKEN